MALIGIIANPASGKDIRRLVSYATTIDNNEKVNICKRVVLSAQAMGVSDFVFMPETFMIGYAVKDDLESDLALTANIGILDFEIDASIEDTVTSARMMEEMGADCIVVLGGDGTSRAVAKGISKTPILPISTGTNNVYPAMMEGTVAGMAAAAVSLMEDPYSCCRHDKRIEIFVNGEFRDLALIDAVVSDDFFTGAKAIWDAERIKMIVVTRCHPATIGFSAAAGVYEIVEDTDDYGLALVLDRGGEQVLAPIAAGVLTTMEITEARRIPLDGRYEFTASRPCMIALDGEREVRLCEGDRADFVVTRSGPWRVLPRPTLFEAARLGMYRK